MPEDQRPPQETLYPAQPTTAYPAPAPQQESPELLTLLPRPAFSLRTVFVGADGLRAGWSLLIFLLIFSALLTPIVRTLAARHKQSAPAASQRSTERPVSEAIRQDGIGFLILLIATLAMSRIEKRPLAAYGIGPTPHALRQFLFGLLWGLAFLSLLVLTLRATHLLTFDGRLLSGAAMLHYGLVWSFAFLLVGLFEEYFLRGYLQFTLARGLSGLYGALSTTPHRDALGFWTAAVLLSFTFGLGHGSNPGESPIGLLSAGTAALVFLLSLWRTGSLWWAIGFHAAWDWAQSFLYGVADSGLMMQHHLFASHPLGTPLLSGGLTGPEGSIFVLPVLALVAVVIWRTLPQTPRPSPAARALPPVPSTPALS